MNKRIPQSFIDELLARVDIVSVIEPFVQLKKAGSNYKALCPFHQEKTPSFTLSSSKQFYHCFGCGASGNAITFLMEYERMDFIDVIEHLASQTGLEIPQEFVADQTASSEVQPLYVRMEQSSKFYQTQLRNVAKSKPAITYLKQRKLSKEVVRRFNIGYAPIGWDNLLRYFDNSSVTHKQLFTAGMVIQKEGGDFYDRFRHRIMFPIRDRRGRVIAFGGRVLSDDDTPKYLNSPETPIFHKGNELYGLYEVLQLKSKLNSLLIVEGYTDVVALAQYGIDYAVATLGTATSANHIQRLFRLVPEVVFCFDGDKAGRSAAWHALEVMMPILRDNWQVKFMFLPEGEDPDSLVRKIGKEAFAQKIKQADVLSEFFFQYLTSQVDLDKMDGRAQLANLVMSYIQKMPMNVRREMLCENLAKQVGIDSEKLMRATKKSNEKIENKVRIDGSFGKMKLSPARIAIAILMQNPVLAKEIVVNLPESNMPGMRLLSELINLLKSSSSKLTAGNIIERWRGKPEEKYLTQLTNYEFMIPADVLTIELQAAMRKLCSQVVDVEIDGLMAKASNGELVGKEKQKLQNLLKERQNF
jgi:DNA primase